MGFETPKRKHLESKPKTVRDAIAAGDHLRLQALASAGGRASAEKKARLRTEDEMLEVKREEEEYERRRQTNEDKYPPEIYD